MTFRSSHFDLYFSLLYLSFIIGNTLFSSSFNPIVLFNCFSKSYIFLAYFTCKILLFYFSFAFCSKGSGKMSSYIDNFCRKLIVTCNNHCYSRLLTCHIINHTHTINPIRFIYVKVSKFIFCYSCS